MLSPCPTPTTSRPVTVLLLLHRDSGPTRDLAHKPLPCSLLHEGSPRRPCLPLGFTDYTPVPYITRDLGESVSFESGRPGFESRLTYSTILVRLPDLTEAQFLHLIKGITYALQSGLEDFLKNNVCNVCSPVWGTK